MAEQQLDVLVYPDLGMEPLTFFMAFARLAPVQVRAPPPPPTLFWVAGWWAVCFGRDASEGFIS